MVGVHSWPPLCLSIDYDCLRFAPWQWSHVDLLLVGQGLYATYGLYATWAVCDMGSMQHGLYVTWALCNMGCMWHGLYATWAVCNMDCMRHGLCGDRRGKVDLAKCVSGGWLLWFVNWQWVCVSLNQLQLTSSWSRQQLQESPNPSCFRPELITFWFSQAELNWQAPLWSAQLTFTHLWFSVNQALTNCQSQLTKLWSARLPFSHCIQMIFISAVPHNMVSFLNPFLFIQTFHRSGLTLVQVGWKGFKEEEWPSVVQSSLCRLEIGL